MIKKGWIVAMLGAAAMATSASAFAQRAGSADTGWYVAGYLGQNDDFDDQLAWKLSAGYQINRNLSAEFGYTSLGKASVLGTDIKANAWELVGMYKFPLQNRFSIYGLLGFARIKAEAVVPFFGKVSDTSTELTYGFGGQYDFSSQMGLRAQYQDYDGSAVISVGVVYKF